MAQAAHVQSRKSTRYPRAVSGSSDTPVALTPAQRVTAQISALLERGVRPWIRPWDDITPPDALVFPLRSCGTPYRGMNIIALWAATLECGFKSRHWFTFKQALALNACVRKGERGSYVVYYTELTSKTGEGAVPRQDDTSETRRILRGYTVFNADQIDRLPLDFYTKPDVEPTPLSPITKSEDRSPPIRPLRPYPRDHPPRRQSCFLFQSRRLHPNAAPRSLPRWHTILGNFGT